MNLKKEEPCPNLELYSKAAEYFDDRFYETQCRLVKSYDNYLQEADKLS